jgi:type I restriction enzyme S subunit
MLDGLVKYDSYKDSGVRWIDEVPSDWSSSPLVALATPRKTSGHPHYELLSVYLDRGVIRFSDVAEKRTNTTSEDLSNYQVVEVGNFVLNNQQAWRGSVGVSEHQGIVSPAYIVLELSSKLDPRFANYLFRDQTMVAHYLVCSKGVGTIQRNLYWPSLKRVPVYYPDLDTQNRIVKFLDEKTAEIDAAVVKKRRLIDLLNEQKAILINRAVTNGLNPDATMKDSGVDWIGEIPAHWDVKRNKNIFSDINQRSVGGLEQHLSMSQKLGLVPSNMVEKSLESESYEGAKLVQQGDLVLNRLKAHLAVFSVAPMVGVISPDYSVFRLIHSEANPHYFERLFKTPEYLGEFNRKVKGIVAGFYRLYSADFMSIPLIVPPHDEQRDIHEHIDGLNKAFTPLFETVEQEITTLNEFKQTLIANAVTGKIKI